VDRLATAAKSDAGLIKETPAVGIQARELKVRKRVERCSSPDL
jgi:hypothetical protein